MKLLGIDYGRRRIGVAITDTSGQFIRPYTVIDRLKHPDAGLYLKTIIDKEAPQKIIVGLPLDIDDNETLMAKEIRAFTETFGEGLLTPIEFVDESLTSLQAQGMLRAHKKKRRRDKSAVDAIAACLILEAFIKENGCDGTL